MSRLYMFLFRQCSPPARQLLLASLQKQFPSQTLYMLQQHRNVFRLKQNENETESGSMWNHRIAWSNIFNIHTELIYSRIFLAKYDVAVFACVYWLQNHDNYIPETVGTTLINNYCTLQINLLILTSYWTPFKHVTVIVHYFIMISCRSKSPLPAHGRIRHARPCPQDAVADTSSAALVSISSHCPTRTKRIHCTPKPQGASRRLHCLNHVLRNTWRHGRLNHCIELHWIMAALKLES